MGDAAPDSIQVWPSVLFLECSGTVSERVLIPPGLDTGVMEMCHSYPRSVAMRSPLPGFDFTGVCRVFEGLRKQYPILLSETQLDACSRPACQSPMTILLPLECCIEFWTRFDMMRVTA